MLTVEIHGFGAEDAAGMRGSILRIIFGIPWTNPDLDSVEICGDNIMNHNDKSRPQLRLFTNYSKMENNLIIAKLSVLKLPIHTISTQVYEGE